MKKTEITSITTSESTENQYKLTDWKTVNKEVDNLQWVSIDTNIDPDIFPYGKGIKKIADTMIDNENHYLAYEKDKGYTKTRVEGILPINEEFIFSKNIFKTYLILNEYAYTEKTLNSIIRKRDLAKRLGANKNSNLYKDIPGYIEFLTKASYTIEDKKNKTREWGHIINYAKEINTDPKSKESYFYYELNPHYHKYLQAHIEKKNELPRSQYVKYPINYNQSRDNAISNMLLRLQGVKKTYEYTIKKLLEKTNVSEKEIETESTDYLINQIPLSLPEGWSWIISDKEIEKLLSINKYIDLRELVELTEQTGIIGVINEFKLAENRIRTEGITETFKRFTKQDFLKLKITFLNSKYKREYKKNKEKIKPDGRF